MWGNATFATEVSKTSMNVAKLTVIAMSHGLCFGTHGCCSISLMLLLSSNARQKVNCRQFSKGLGTRFLGHLCDSSIKSWLPELKCLMRNETFVSVYRIDSRH